MGFRTGAYCTVWEIRSTPDKRSVLARISVDKKDRATDSYKNDFSGWVYFCGSSASNAAAALSPKSRIKLGDVDVRSVYNAEKKETSYFFNIWSFETQADTNRGTGVEMPTEENNEPQPSDDGTLPY